MLLGSTMTDRASAQAVGFRIETDVFAEGVKEPQQQTLTLFSNGIGYVISREDDGELSMVDTGRDRIILLNTKLNIRTEVKISPLRQFIDSAKASPELSVFVLGAKQIDDSGDRIRVGDEMLSYEASIQHPSNASEAAAICDTYHQYVDALALLNSTSPGAAPPFARLALNAAIQSKGGLPKQITKTAKRGKREVVHKVLLHGTWLLSKQDQQRINDIGKKITDTSFDDVDYAEYQRRMAELFAVR
jgi:hypothetical protein